MTNRKDVLGKIFISHSSLDKPFVRRLQKRLEKDGYEVWIDEKDMLVGDFLSSSISKAIEEAFVFLVIISSAAIKSKWLKFELNAGTERMVQGQCRLIPIVIEKVTLPSEVKGILYSDFSSSFKDGYRQILTALEYEYQERKLDLSFWQRTELIAEEIFGSISHASLDYSYKKIDYSCFDLPFLKDNNQNLSVVFESLTNYTGDMKLDCSWWGEFQEVNEIIDHELLFLVITDREIKFPIDSTSEKSILIKTKRLFENKYSKHLVVFVDLSSVGKEEWKPLIQLAKDELINYAKAELNVSSI